MHSYIRAVIRLLAFWFCLPLAVVLGQGGTPTTARTETGERIFKSACAACHGADGRGTPKEIAGFEKPRTFPDFTACDQTTPEPSTAWKDVITHGGRTRGFSDIMPSFGEALTSEQIDDVIAYVRGFCRNSHWPRGELILRRPLLAGR